MTNPTAMHFDERAGIYYIVEDLGAPAWHEDVIFDISFQQVPHPREGAAWTRPPPVRLGGRRGLRVPAGAGPPGAPDRVAEDQHKSRGGFHLRLQESRRAFRSDSGPPVGGSSSRDGVRGYGRWGTGPDTAAGVTELRRPALTCSSMAKSPWTAQCSTTFWSSIRNTCRLVARPRASTTAAAEDRGRVRGSRA
jgi:hypothetical protein